MPEYLYVGDEPRYFPSLGLHLEPAVDEQGVPTGEPVPFTTDAPVASPLVLTADGAATHVDDQGFGIEDPATNADPDPERHLPIVDEQGETEGAEVAVAPGADPALGDLTEKELRKLASEAEIPGRSKMTEAELVAALADAAQQAPTDTTEPVAGEGTTDTTEE